MSCVCVLGWRRDDGCVTSCLNGCCSRLLLRWRWWFLFCRRIRNCVSTVNLDMRPDLAHIATHARNAEYNPKVSACFGGMCRASRLAVTSPRFTPPSLLPVGYDSASLLPSFVCESQKRRACYLRQERYGS